VILGTTAYRVGCSAVNRSAAETLAEEWRRSDPGDPDGEAAARERRATAIRLFLEETVPEVDPDGDRWAVLGTEAFPLLLVLSERGMHVIESSQDDEVGFMLGSGFVPYEGIRLVLAERVVEQNGAMTRIRGWELHLPARGEPISYRTEELLDAPREPSKGERFARALAREIGWAIPESPAR
jgi:hypothetical protein